MKRLYRQTEADRYFAAVDKGSCERWSSMGYFDENE